MMIIYADSYVCCRFFMPAPACRFLRRSAYLLICYASATLFCRLSVEASLFRHTLHAARAPPPRHAAALLMLTLRHATPPGRYALRVDCLPRRDDERVTLRYARYAMMRY